MPKRLNVAADGREFVAYVAIDMASQKHTWKMVEADSQKSEQGEMKNTPEAVDAWAAGLHQRFREGRIAVCLEQKRGNLVYMLGKYPQLVLFPVHPTTAARYRTVFRTSGAKDDPIDTDSMLDLLLKHPEEIAELRQDTAETRQMQFLVEERRRTVDEKTRQVLRLTDCFKTYFPQMLDWFDDVSSPTVGALLKRWGSLQELQRAHPGTLKKFFHEHNSRTENRIQERIQGIQSALPATNDKAVLEAYALVARGLAATLAVLRDNIKTLEQRIDELVAEHPDRAIFASLPGAGRVLVPRLIVAFGTDRERFGNAFEMQCYSGIAPVKQASGKISWVHCRWFCPKFVRQTFHEFAACSIREGGWAKDYYQHQRDKGNSHHTAVRALAFKWIRIIFRCWKDRKPYDATVYEESRRRHGSLLGPDLKPVTVPKWNTVAGFQKFSANPS
jgi:transposase